MLAAICVFHGTMAAQSVTSYVPAFNVAGRPETTQGGETVTTRWRSTITIFNGSSESGYFQTTGGYGFTPNCPQQGFLPHSAVNQPDCLGLPTDALTFVRVTTSPNIVINAELEKLVERPSCPEYGYQGGVLVSRGRSPLPIYPSLFPAGATGVCGEVDLGAVNVPPPCAPGQERAPRRVNVTLLNADSVTSRFHIEVYAVTNMGVPLAAQDVVLSPGEIRQLNDLRFPSGFGSQTDTSARAWITVRADGVFLAYASAILNESVVGSNSFEVYPARLAP